VVALTRYMDGRKDGWTDGQGDSYIPPNFVCGGHRNHFIVCVVHVNKLDCLRCA
jgi:hypothetical protein